MIDFLKCMEVPTAHVPHSAVDVAAVAVVGRHCPHFEFPVYCTCQAGASAA